MAARWNADAMKAGDYGRLCSIARREGRGSADAEDLVQEALLAAVLAGRTDFDDPGNLGWLTGTVRNRARMAARSASRRRQREDEWLARAEPQAVAADDRGLVDFLSSLPPSLRGVAALILSGHNRREIGHLLSLSDTALRQRVVALKRRIVGSGLTMPRNLPGLGLNLAYGRIREALLPLLLRDGGVLASHDPDGHLFVIRRSQNDDRRQYGVQTSMEGSP